MAKASLTVLRDHPKLIVLPVLSGAALILALAVLFGIFMFEAGDFQGAGRLVKNLEQSWDSNKIALGAGVIALAWLFTSVSLYFNAALVFCVLRAFNGERPSIAEGLATAAGRLPQIIGWAFVAAIVGVIISVIQDTLKDKLGFLGSLLGGLFDFAWAAITYFVLPVLVVEGLGPVGAVKRSSSILKQTWGEAATGSQQVAFQLMSQFLGVMLGPENLHEPVAQRRFLLFEILMLRNDLVFAPLQRLVQLGYDAHLLRDEFARSQGFFSRRRKMHQYQFDAPLLGAPLDLREAVGRR